MKIFRHIFQACAVCLVASRCAQHSDLREGLEGREKHFVYVDKTEFVWNLANLGKVYFLSPRADLEKAFFCPGLRHIFAGKKNYLQGLP